MKTVYSRGPVKEKEKKTTFHYSLGLGLNKSCFNTRELTRVTSYCERVVIANVIEIHIYIQNPGIVYWSSFGIKEIP